jgi:hypothetical protein
VSDDETLEEAVKSGDRRRSLVALRDYLAHELQVHRCAACQAFQLRTGDTAALVLRLQKVMEELESIPTADAEVTEVERIRQDRDSGAPDNVRLLGSKNAQRRQGGRRTGR